MNIKNKRDGSKLFVSVTGRIDTATSPELDKFLGQNLDGVTELVLDFAEVNYISSAGLRVLLSTHKKMMAKGEMELVNVNETVNDVFEVTGFDEILNYKKA